MRCLICSIASPGLVYPAIRVGMALRERGHEVAFVTDVVFADTLRSEGIARIPRGQSDGPSFQIAHWGKPLSVAMQVKHIDHAIVQFQPDVLVGQPLTLGAYIAHERHNVPLAVLGLSVYLWPPCQRAAQGSSNLDRRRAWRYNDVLNDYNQARQLFGLSPCDEPPEATSLLGDRFLLQSVPALTVEPLPSKVQLVGSCLWEPSAPEPELEHWVADAECQGIPLIYVQHGRTFDAPRCWPNLLAALHDQPVRVVAAIGRLDDEVGELPPNVFARPHIPQAAVLPHCQGVICTGNTTAVLGALTHGLPLLLLPAGGEQIDVAERCTEAGCAHMLPASADAAMIRQALNAVLADTQMRARAQGLQRAFGQMNGPTIAAHAIELLPVTSG